MRSLIAYGERIVTDVSVPGAVSPGDAIESMACVTVQCIDAHAADPGPHPLYTRTSDGLIFAPPRVARYHCSAAGIVIDADAEADPGEVTGLLLSTALPAVQWVKQRFVLHAAGAALPGARASIALTGPSGIGKSSVLADLLADGATLLGDDTLSLTCERGTCTAAGLAGGYYRSETANGSRAFHAVDRHRSAVSSPLGAIVVLADAMQDNWSIEPLAMREAVEQLLSNQHRPRVPALLGMHAAVVRTCAAIARCTPVWRWRRPRQRAALNAAERASLATVLTNSRTRA